MAEEPGLGVAALIAEIDEPENHAASQRYYDALRVCIDGLEGGALINGLALIDALSASLAQSLASGDRPLVLGLSAFFHARMMHHLHAIRAAGMGVEHVNLQ